jgi:EpsI family protein
MKGYTPLGPKIVEALELDDYANQNYSNGNDTISLYIGYYFTAKKIGVAHDPLVCFPGQGWVVSDKKKDKIVLNPKPGDSISYSSMIVHRGLQKELIIYWLQSYDKANPDTFSQKITYLYQKIFQHREDNAFVRVSTPMVEKSLSECQETIHKFIRAFYPIFLNYVRQG